MRVSIVIPVRNSWEYTRACLASIRAHTPDDACEVILVDNASTDETGSGLANEFPWVHVLRNTEPHPFAASCNQGASAAQGDLLLFLNNDTEVTPGWLPPLLQHIDSDANLVGVGPLLLYPDGAVQHAGIVFNADHGGQNFGRYWRADHPAFSGPRKYPALTAACLLCRASEFRAVGGFDEAFITGYEDVDLCLKWRERGRAMLSVPQSRVIHHESRSAGRYEFEKQNVALYMQRWKHRVPQDNMGFYDITRQPHLTLDTIGVIITPQPEMGRHLEICLHFLFMHSQCALPVLIVAPGEWVQSYLALGLGSSLISAVDAADTAAQMSWVSRQLTGKRLRGILRLGWPINLPVNWDTTMARWADARGAFSPIIDRAVGAQAWTRYVAFAHSLFPTAPKGGIERFLSRQFGDSCVRASSVSDDCVFVTRAEISAMGAAAPARLCGESAHRECSSYVLPALMVQRGDGGLAEEPFPPATIVVVSTGSQRHEFGARPPELSEIVFVHGVSEVAEAETVCARPSQGILAMACVGRRRDSQLYNCGVGLGVSPYLICASPNIDIDSLSVLAALQQIHKTPDIAGVGCRFRRDSSGALTPQPLLPGRSPGGDPGVVDTSENAWAGWWMAMRRADLLAVKGFDENLDFGVEAADLALRLCALQSRTMAMGSARARSRGYRPKLDSSAFEHVVKAFRAKWALP
jgi:GT2 family glycosyltransferase